MTVTIESIHRSRVINHEFRAFYDYGKYVDPQIIENKFFDIARRIIGDTMVYSKKNWQFTKTDVNNLIEYVLIAVQGENYIGSKLQKSGGWIVDFDSSDWLSKLNNIISLSVTDIKYNVTYYDNSQTIVFDYSFADGKPRYRPMTNISTDQLWTHSMYCAEETARILMTEEFKKLIQICTLFSTYGGTEKRQIYHKRESEFLR